MEKTVNLEAASLYFFKHLILQYLKINQVYIVPQT